MAYNYSVVVPYRDKYDLFVKAIDSIPDREDIQVIIVDNAPEQLPQEKIPVKQHARVDYTTSSPTQGAGCARNEGLKHVEGAYVLFLDADDYFTTEAFTAFDRHLLSHNDIVFFMPTSVRLNDGALSDRHETYASHLDVYFKTGNTDRLRYRFEPPWAKMFSADFLKKGGFQFEEKLVGNDAWFSLQTGHYAKKIVVDSSTVYVVTEGGEGQSLTKKVSRENVFSRYKGAIKINGFLKSVGRYNMHIRLIGFMRIAYRNFGLSELVKYLKYAWVNKANIF